MIFLLLYNITFNAFSQKTQEKVVKGSEFDNGMTGDSIGRSYWNGHKNIISLLPFELIIGSLGIQYERSIKPDHSLGFHSSIYLFGWGYSVNNYTFVTNNFNGIKMAAFYRYYFNSKKTHRHFIEGQLMAGYFNFHPLIYKDYQEDYNYVLNYNLTIGKDLDFWSYGAGLAIGWAIPMPRFSHKIFNLTLGSQYFPLLAPKRFTVQDGDNTSDYLRDELWWYLGGPGSVLQIKVSYGGYF